VACSNNEERNATITVRRLYRSAEILYLGSMDCGQDPISRWRNLGFIVPNSHLKLLLGKPNISYYDAR
jgi:hypothetical protein